jgi:hypothetical protein
LFTNSRNIEWSGKLLELGEEFTRGMVDTTLFWKTFNNEILIV